MKALNRLVTAGKDAPLYHWMNVEKSARSFNSDKLRPLFSHKLFGKDKGISLTRNSLYSHDWAGDHPIRLTFNQRKLAQRYKIIPIDAERAAAFDRLKNLTRQEFLDYEGDRNSKTKSYNRGQEMAEEYIKGIIDPLHKYLDEIYLMKYGHRDNPAFMRALVRYLKKYPHISFVTSDPDFARNYLPKGFAEKRGNFKEVDYDTHPVTKKKAMRAITRLFSKLAINKDDALARLRGSYCSFRIVMDPMDFIKLTTENEKQIKTIQEQSKERIKEDHQGTSDYPYMMIDYKTGRVVGHEGRHRAAYLISKGKKTFPVAVYMYEYYKTKGGGSGRGILKGHPTRSEPFKYSKWRVEDFPPILKNQFGTRFKVPKEKIKVIKPFNSLPHHMIKAE